MDLKRRTLDGLAWTFLARLIVQIVQYIVSVVIARLLVPDDFGMLAMVAAFTGVAGVFLDLGIGAAIVQRRDLTEDQTRASFLATTSLGVVLTALTFVCAPLVAAFYRRPELAPITRAMSLSFVLNSFGVVPRAILQRNLRLRTIALSDVVGNGIGSLLNLALALAGARVWSIVVGTMSGSAIASGLAWVIAGRLRPTFTLAAVRPLLGVSVNLMGFNFANYWARNADNLIIGKLLGEHELGVYVRAYSLMMLAVSQISATVSVGMVPAMAAVQGDLERTQRMYLRAIGMTALVSFPLMVGLSACAETFIRTIYGSKWLDAIPILRILALVGALQAVLHPAGWIFVSQGRTDRMLRIGLLTVPIIVIGFAIGATFRSAKAVAWSYLITNIIICIPEMRASGACIDLPARRTARALWKNVASAAALWIAVWGVGHISHDVPGAVTLTLQALVGSAVFVATAGILREPALDDAKEIIVERWRRLHAKLSPSSTAR